MKTGHAGIIGMAAALAMLIAGCGDNGNVDINVTNNVPPVPVPVAEPIISVGISSAANSIIVNGVRYRTDNARASVDGQAGDIADIRPGHVVAVSGTLNADQVTGTADTIEAQTALRGQIDGIDGQTGTISMMGQTVLTDPGTVFGPGIDPPGAAGLRTGSRVLVSGMPDSAGELLATRIDVAPPGTDVRLWGKVSGLNLADLLFHINGQLVDYGGAALIDLPGGMPANGQSLVAVGALRDGILVADELLGASGLPAAPGLRVQISGFVTRFSSVTDFDVLGIPVTTGVGTAYSSGSAGDLALDSRVFIDGDIVAGSRLLAGRLAFIDTVGETEMLRYDFQDFDEITIGGAFDARITSDAGFSVDVTVDQAAINQFDVWQQGTRVNIGILGETSQFDTLEAAVSAPTLERLELTGVVNGWLSGFSQAQLNVALSGVSALYGEADAITSLAASVDGVSQLDFGNVRPISAAFVNVSGVSSATLNMGIGASLSGTVTGTSRLFYYGTDVDLNVLEDATASVVRLGATRP